MSPDQSPSANGARGGRKVRAPQAGNNRPGAPRARTSGKAQSATGRMTARGRNPQQEEIQETENEGDDNRTHTSSSAVTWPVFPPSTERKLPTRSSRRSGSRTTPTSRGDGGGSDFSGDGSSSEALMSTDDSEVDMRKIFGDESSESESVTSEDSESSAEGSGKRKRGRLHVTRRQRGRGRGRGRGGGRVRREGRGRGSHKRMVPRKLLEWEMFDEQWENQWGGMEDEDIEALQKQSNAPAQMSPPPELLMPLLPFQKEWLGWSLKQEASEIQGGILADEMGMGKTIQAISLIVTDRHLNGPVDSSRQATVHRPECSDGTGNGAEPSVELPQVKATLVICPLVAVIQWRCEIEKFTPPGSVKVLIYHGPKRGLGVAELLTYDVVLSTYSIVESEHRKNIMPPKEQCIWCGKYFYPDRLSIHQRYFCGPYAQRTVKQAKQVKRKATTASIVLGQVGDTESDEDLKKGKGKSKGKKSAVPATKGRGQKRKVDADDLDAAMQEAVDSVPDTSNCDTARGNSVLHSVKWARIILDEAHSIKDRRCSTAKAVFALKSTYKWALSGTPLQNRVGELYSLVRFLGVDPFSYYFCRNCDCKSLDYKFSQGNKCECGHSPLLHFCWWNKFIANPIKKWGYIDEGRRAMTILRHLVLNKTLLRRTKLERAADLALPPRTAYLRRDVFDAREEDFYQALYTQSQSQFNTYVDAGTLLNNYAHIFDLLTRLRQAVNHPYLVVYSATACSVAPKYDAPVQEAICGICHEPAEDTVKTGCQHPFCRICMEEYMEAGKDLSTLQCPTCQTALMVDLTRTGPEELKEVAAKVPGRKRTSILNRIKLENFQSSTKIDAVREELFNMLEKDPAAKAIIFSQFNAMLELIGFCLEKSKIRFVKLDGSMSMQARDQMIARFTNDADTKVFLMSLKAGGVALNLTVASHVFLMDPWWNPAVEQQAQDRIHRLGQYKPVRVIRFVIENTIEERILKLQEKKQLVFEGTVGGSAEALGRLTEDDLRFLFTN